MAFCANCGGKVGDNDKFCASCGATRVPAQAAAPPPPPPPPPPPQPQYQAPPQQPPPQYQPPPQQGYMPPPNYQQPGMQPTGMAGASSTGLQENIAGLLCYLGTWVTGIIFLLIEKRSHFVKFHAAQSTVIFIIIGVLAFVLGRIPYIWWLGSIVGLAGFILWIVLMVKAYQGQLYKLPVIGSIAESLAGKVQM
jgi:uncharacterized membrane protein